MELIRKRVPELREQIDLEVAAASTILHADPTLDMIQAQQQVWQHRLLQTNEWLSLLTHRASLLQAALTRLADLQQTWHETLEVSKAANAPGPVLAQIDAVLADIDAARTPIASERTAVLDLQSVVAEAVGRASTVLAQFTQAQRRAMGGMLERDSPPLWAGEGWARARADLPERIRRIAVVRWNDYVQYVRDPSRGMALHIAILAMLSAVFCAARRGRRRWRAVGDDELQTIAVFDRPYAAALIVVLLIASSPMYGVPLSVRRLCVVLALVPVIRLTRPVIDPRLVSTVYALGVLFALDSLRQAVERVSVLEQAILEVEMLAGIVVLGRSLTSGSLRLRSGAGAETERVRVFRIGAGLVVLTLAAGLVAGATGYMRLARLLASSVFSGGVLALTLYACTRVATGVVALTLRVWPLNLLQMVQHHRDQLERRVHGVLIVFAIGAWAARFLDRIDLFQPAWSLGGAILTAKLGRGSISFSAGDVLEFVLTVWLAYLVSAFIRFVLREDVYPRTRLTRGISYAISSLLNYVIIALGFALALGVLGLDLTRVTVLVGAFGVGIGFGLQSVVNNFVSGLILLFERPVHVGDIVEVGELSGEVSRIGIRASTVRTWQGAEIIVPNAQLVTERVTNWTLSDRTRRIDLRVGVDYGSAPEKVVEVLEGVGRAHPQVLKDPAPQAVFIAFGDSSINFELRAWTNRFERWPKIQTELAVAVYAALPAAGMTLPFPQREVRILNDAARSH
ncbi:MAG: hypothetical protein DMD90_24630 [Candidatus Rokuibacteriota bacterium]|nr:MAG: hypothetical protein DMD90_24630 [Candidatus Rokubacteria bacterium]